MNSIINTQQGGELCPVRWRRSGVDFDQEGTKSTLHEMLQLGGLFPLGKIADRLPISIITLRAWARRGRFTDCFVSNQKGSNGKRIPTLVHLDLLEERLRAFTQRAGEGDQETDRTQAVSFLDEAGGLAV